MQFYAKASLFTRKAPGNNLNAVCPGAFLRISLRLLPVQTRPSFFSVRIFSVKRAALLAVPLLLSLLSAAASAADEMSVRDHLMQKTGLRADAVRKAPVEGLWEILIQDRLFYVDETVSHVFSGSILETATQMNLTQARLREIAREQWAKWPLNDAVKEVYGSGKRQVVVFSDANCTYCRMMSKTFETAGDITVYTFIVPMIRGEANNREIVCSKDPSGAWHNWMANGVRPESAPPTCDASVLRRNYELSHRFNVTGAPTMFFPSGERYTGAITTAQLEQLLAE